MNTVRCLWRKDSLSSEAENLFSSKVCGIKSSFERCLEVRASVEKTSFWAFWLKLRTKANSIWFGIHEVVKDCGTCVDADACGVAFLTERLTAKKGLANRDGERRWRGYDFQAARHLQRSRRRCQSPGAYNRIRRQLSIRCELLWWSWKGFDCVKSLY